MRTHVHSHLSSGGEWWADEKNNSQAKERGTGVASHPTFLPSAQGLCTSPGPSFPLPPGPAGLGWDGLIHPSPCPWEDEPGNCSPSRLTESTIILKGKEKQDILEISCLRKFNLVLGDDPSSCSLRTLENLNTTEFDIVT